MKYLKDVGTLQFKQAACRGCGRCAEVCPRGVFELKNGVAGLTDADRCIECGACMRNCEFGAISVRPGVGCAAALLRPGDKKGCCG